MFWKRAGPLNTLAALRVSGISPSRPVGLVQSKPVFAPVRRPCSDGSIDMPGMPCRIIRSWSAWKRVPSAHSTCLSLRMSMSSSNTKTCLSREMPPNSAAIASRASPKAALPDRDAQRVRAARGVPHIDRDRIAPEFFRMRIASASTRIALMFWLSVWSSMERRAVLQRVMQHVAAHGDGGAVKHRVHVDRAVVAHVFAERAFRLDIAALVEIALERHLGVGRHQDVVGQALDDRRGLAAHGRDQRQLVAGMAHGRGDEVERMGADGEGDRQLLAARDDGRVDALEIGRRGDVGAGLGAVAQAQPAAADVAPPGRRIDHVVGGRAEIATAVVGVVRVERQLGQIDVLAGDLAPRAPARRRTGSPPPACGLASRLKYSS